MKEFFFKIMQTFSLQIQNLFMRAFEIKINILHILWMH